MPDAYTMAMQLLPLWLREQAAALPAHVTRSAEEIRLRTGRRATLRTPEREFAFGDQAVTPPLLSEVLEAATRASYHAAAEQLRRGFLNAPGGVRVGVCGTAVLDGTLRSLRDVSSLCIRIPRQVPGAGREIMPRLGGDSVLILSPPGGGKTTLLRELVRTVSDRGVRVSLADERGELAGMWEGVPQFDVGRCTDVMTGVPKAEAAMLLLRAMGPEAVAMDEISAPEDAKAVETLSGCGVRIFATAHAEGKEEFLRRPVYRMLAELGVFRQLVYIRGSAPRRYEVEQL